MSLPNSPWLFELNTDRKSQKLEEDKKTNIAIVGAGIAGVSTAFFILENTNKKVILIDRNRVAHGATGHNAGQVVSYFERPFHEIVEEFGLDMACDAQKAIESGWELLDHMYTKAGLDMTLSRFIGHAGFLDKEKTIEALEKSRLLKEGGMNVKDFFIDEKIVWLPEIEEKYKGLFRKVDRKEILEKLETKEDKYLACVAAQVGCLNSARFCEEVVQYMIKNYSDRFYLYEHTKINKVVLHEKNALLDAENYTIETGQVILCTNGFEHFEILNKSGLDINTKFHHNIRGEIGYMSAYLDKLNKPPFAAQYYDNNYPDIPYFYVTRRPYDFGGISSTNLISIGGPQIVVEDRENYSKEDEYPEVAKKEIEDFVKRVYGETTEKKFEHNFLWHGLMGYTTNKMRLLGREPKNPILMYNLGCNGVGILPSIYGGWKIGNMIKGEKFPPSAFDPK